MLQNVNKVVIFLLVGVLAGCVGKDLTSLEGRFGFDILRDFAFVSCVAQSHRQQGDFDIATQLDRISWQLLGKGQYKGQQYYLILKESKQKGNQVPVSGANDYCKKWSQSKELRGLFYRSL